MDQETPAAPSAPSKGVKINNGAKRPARRPQAKKRDLQSAKRAVINSAHKSRVNTAKRKLADSIAKKEPVETLRKLLSTVESLMDQGVKRGIFKLNKASRTKSRLSAKI